MNNLHKSTPEISIIIPVYNVEKYLKECIESVLSQTFSDFELILVDDGSTDNSGNICDKYSLIDSRIKVFHKPNGGVSSARNYGLKIAKGKWITFIDADDKILPSLLDDYFKYPNSDIDLLIQGFKDNLGNIESLPLKKVKGSALSPSSQYSDSTQLLCFVWNKLYRTSIIRDNDIRFNENISMIEDRLFNLQFILKSKYILFVPFVNYYYIRRGDSACFRDHSFESWQTLLDAMNDLHNSLTEEDFEYVRQRNKIYYELSLDILRSAYKKSIEKKAKYIFIKKIKERAGANDLITIENQKTVNNKIITFMIKFFPVYLCDLCFRLAKPMYR